MNLQVTFNLSFNVFIWAENKLYELNQQTSDIINVITLLCTGLRNGNISLTAAPKQIGNSNERELRKEKDLRYIVCIDDHKIGKVVGEWFSANLCNKINLIIYAILCC